MTPRELAIVLALIGALAIALACWSWHMSSQTYPRNVHEDHLPESGIMPPP